jgi:hypothetical protein
MSRFKKWLIVPAVLVGALAFGATNEAQAQFGVSVGGPYGGVSVGVPGAYSYYGAPYYRPPVYGYAPGYGYPAYAGYYPAPGISVGVAPFFGYRPYGYGGYHHHGRW